MTEKMTDVLDFDRRQPLEGLQTRETPSNMPSGGRVSAMSKKSRRASVISWRSNQDSSMVVGSGSVKKWKKMMMYVVVVSPLVCVALLSTVALQRTIGERMHIARVKEEMLIVEQIRTLINNLQRERVQSCVYLRNDSPEKVNQIVLQLAGDRANTDRSADVMTDMPAAWPERDGYRNRQDFADTMANGRDKIDKEQIECSDTIMWYHRVVDFFIFDQIISEFEYLGGQAKLWGQIHAYTGWILGREENDLGSGLGSKLFSDGALDVKQYSYFYQVEGAAYEFLKFSGTASETVRHMFDKIQFENAHILKTITDLKHEVLLNNFTEPDIDKSLAWHKTTTQYDSALSAGEQSISDAVLEDLDRLWADNNFELVLTLVVAGFCLTFCPLFALYYMMHVRYTKKLSERTRKLYQEEKKKGNLLYQLLPKNVATKILNGEYVEPESFESVTIFFSDIVQFTNLSARSTPLQVVGLLNDLYGRFDAILDMHDCYKVETVGDGFLAVSGLPKRNELRHSAEMAQISLEVLMMISKFKVPHMPDQKLQVRIGLHTGPVVAGIVGSKRPYYCLFGDTVNTASRMESNGKGMHIQLSEWTRDHLLAYHPEFEMKRRGTLNVKGKGQMTTYWLVAKHGIGYRAKAEADEPQGEEAGHSAAALEQPDIKHRGSRDLPKIKKTKPEPMDKKSGSVSG